MASMYDLTVPMFSSSLQALSGILKKAEEHAKSSNVSLSDYLEGCLAPDMRPLPFQIQVACNTAKFVAVRVGGVENVATEDTEKTFEELQARITTTLDFLKKVKREDMDGKQGGEVLFHDTKFTGLSYCTNFAIPNFYFHVTAAYAILRMKGVPVGKMDFLGKS